MAIEYIPIEPTLPIPETEGSPITYEQGERLIQSLADHKLDLADQHEQVTLRVSDLNQLLVDIKTNTIPQEVDPVSNPSGIAMTFEQGQVLIESMQTVQAVVLTLTLAIALVFVSKFLYRLIGGTFFG